ncbi:ABC transporter ATP-binding protein [Candidatus Woesearchaeota archaeon]|nr:ABC transporter ATP-binding protein [Nanoarchaeota archaeon]MCB9370208.1 ABC transporter ATP-binding protein [Candidatus Woesearchaeota archaeon]USN44736.1 MAG: ABC transporter ATP-binding protein [Candidatus Woesearchaeota archaeon]
MVKALEIHKLQKTYSSGMQALKGIDFSVEAGDFFALLGPNGAGKSTTIGILSSLVNKTSGSVKIFGYDIDKNLADAKRCLGLVPQELNLNIFESVLDNITNQPGYYGVPQQLIEERAEKYLKKLELWEKRNDKIHNLSGGMKRRVMIARALMHEPKMLILDEPTAGVDIEIRRSLWDFLRELNKDGLTIILTTHYLEEAEELCRNIAIINKGQIMENTSMKKLLRKLDRETFVLDLKEPLKKNPDFGTFSVLSIDETTLEAQLPRSQSLNELFALLNKQKIEVLSMRTKNNRLEELFVQITQGDKHE